VDTLHPSTRALREAAKKTKPRDARMTFNDALDQVQRAQTVKRDEMRAMLLSMGGVPIGVNAPSAIPASLLRVAAWQVMEKSDNLRYHFETFVRLCGLRGWPILIDTGGGDTVAVYEGCENIPAATHAEAAIQISHLHEQYEYVRKRVHAEGCHDAFWENCCGLQEEVLAPLSTDKAMLSIFYKFKGQCTFKYDAQQVRALDKAGVFAGAKRHAIVRCFAAQGLRKSDAATLFSDSEYNSAAHPELGTFNSTALHAAKLCAEALGVRCIVTPQPLWERSECGTFTCIAADLINAEKRGGALSPAQRGARA
jgi:hypothetical protein